MAAPENRVVGELVEAADEGYLEVAGTPDLVLEIVSKTSVRKDTVVLRNLYRQADIPEYWLVDVRGERLQFEILRRGRRGYVASRKKADWVKSAVLDRSFRLALQSDDAGNPEYTLEVS